MPEQDTIRDEVAALHRDWRRLLDGLHVAAGTGNDVFSDLVEAYSAPERFYHNLRHLRAVLNVIDRHRARARNPAAVELAAWFHDAVYDPRASDNEDRSADLAGNALVGMWIDGATAGEVWRLVRLTRDHRAEENDTSGHLLLDADLAILGADAAEYATYAAAIRQEYAWVAEGAYRAGRAAVLRRFLGRERIYHTPPLAEALEARAQQNLEAELQGLEGGS